MQWGVYTTYGGVSRSCSPSLTLMRTQHPNANLHPHTSHEALRDTRGVCTAHATSPHTVVPRKSTPNERPANVAHVSREERRLSGSSQVARAVEIRAVEHAVGRVALTCHMHAPGHRRANAPHEDVWQAVWQAEAHCRVGANVWQA